LHDENWDASEATTSGKRKKGKISAEDKAKVEDAFLLELEREDEQVAGRSKRQSKQTSKRKKKERERLHEDERGSRV
jgi:hypothetical protein